MRHRSLPSPPALFTLPLQEPTAPRLWARRIPACPRRERAPHLHQFFELVFIEEGEGSQAIDGQRFAAHPGDVFCISPGQLHDPTELHATIKWIVAFRPELLTPGQSETSWLLGATQSYWQKPFTWAREHRDCHMPLPRPVQESWVVRLGQLRDELDAKPLGYSEAARALLQLLLLDVSRLLPPSSPVPRSPSSSLLEAVFGFIETHYRRPIGLRDIAQAVGRSPAYLTDLVHRETGRPVFSWLTERRMVEARRLLLLSSDSIEEIAAAVGYGDPRHFSRQFRQLTGRPPQAWRKAQLGAGSDSTASSAPKDPTPPPKRRAL